MLAGMAWNKVGLGELRWRTSRLPTKLTLLTQEPPRKVFLAQKLPYTGPHIPGQTPGKGAATGFVPL